MLGSGLVRACRVDTVATESWQWTCQTCGCHGLLFIYTPGGLSLYMSFRLSIYWRKKISYFKHTGVGWDRLFDHIIFWYQASAVRFPLRLSRLSIPARRYPAPRLLSRAAALIKGIGVHHLFTFVIYYLPFGLRGDICCTSVHILHKIRTACVARVARGLPTSSCIYKQLVSVQLYRPS